uniref:Uncharacterized protein n=1 Tax=Arundo donax TaxID=35708 RepID=A0A0A8ZRS3_ARUDO
MYRDLWMFPITKTSTDV